MIYLLGPLLSIQNLTCGKTHRTPLEHGKVNPVLNRGTGRIETTYTMSK